MGRVGQRPILNRLAAGQIWLAFKARQCDAHCGKMGEIIPFSLNGCKFRQGIVLQGRYLEERPNQGREVIRPRDHAPFNFVFGTLFDQYFAMLISVGQ